MGVKILNDRLPLAAVADLVQMGFVIDGEGTVNELGKEVLPLNGGNSLMAGFPSWFQSDVIGQAGVFQCH